MFKPFWYRNFKAIVISFRGLLLTFVYDMFDGNMAVLVECHKFHLSFLERKLYCGQIFNRFLKMMDRTFALICGRVCEYEPLLYHPDELELNGMLRYVLKATLCPQIYYSN